MNKQQIKAELLRSACEDEDLWSIGFLAFDEACKWKNNDEEKQYFQDLSRSAHRIFYLLVSEAL
jgi:hypothetical protein